MKALVDLIFKWPSGTDGVLVCTLIDNLFLNKISGFESLTGFYSETGKSCRCTRKFGR